MSVQEEQTKKFIVDTSLKMAGKMLILRLLAHIELLLLTPATSCSDLSISSACGHRRLPFLKGSPETHHCVCVLASRRSRRAPFPRYEAGGSLSAQRRPASGPHPLSAPCVAGRTRPVVPVKHRRTHHKAWHGTLPRWCLLQARIRGRARCGRVMC